MIAMPLLCFISSDTSFFICLGQGLRFMSEFQKMRTMISRMSKQAGFGGEEGREPEDMDLAIAGGGGAGNRNARRAAKKKGKKGGRKGGMGFGAR